MAKFRPIKKYGTGLERWKDEKTRKERRRTGWLIQRKIGKSGKTRSWKEKKRKKTGKRKIFFKRERVSFRSRSNKFWPAHISTDDVFWPVSWSVRQNHVAVSDRLSFQCSAKFRFWYVLQVVIWNLENQLQWSCCWVSLSIGYVKWDPKRERVFHLWRFFA